MTSTESGSAYYNPSNTRTAISFNNNQLSRHQGTTNYDSPANQKPSYGSDSKEGCSSDDKEKETKRRLFASFAPAAAQAAASGRHGLNGDGKESDARSISDRDRDDETGELGSDADISDTEDNEPNKDDDDDADNN